MKLYNSIGPNPKMVRMFMKEKGIELPLVQVDLMGGENRKQPYLEKNPAGQMPALELDDGTFITEITAICEYLDDTHKDGPSLIGITAKERAETHMWTRRIDLNIVEPLTNGFRFAEGLKLFQNRIRCIPEAAEGLKTTAREKLAWLDGLMAGKQFVCGDRFTMADVLLYAFLEFAQTVRQPLDPACKNIAAWYERVKARPSASA
ncbi:glutathione S-transferase family protein [Desertibaculum subflavum]|uniref:glutathione S-transferase family protein n=1 Tax=Desertibaculum subflavum TaxID=2268458 RepID=UPI000E67550F